MSVGNVQEIRSIICKQWPAARVWQEDETACIIQVGGGLFRLRHPGGAATVGVVGSSETLRVGTEPESILRYMVEVAQSAKRHHQRCLRDLDEALAIMDPK